MKCTQTKEVLDKRKDIDIVTFPHDLSAWSQVEIDLAKSYQVFDDLQKTAPILWIDGEKKIGYLRIRKWVQDS